MTTHFSEFCGSFLTFNDKNVAHISDSISVFPGRQNPTEESKGEFEKKKKRFLPDDDNEGKIL